MPNVELMPHQTKAVERMHNGCILKGDVGSGKTITACAYYMKMEADADIYVITTAKKRDELDWEEEFSKFGVGYALDGTTAGRLTVDSWNNLGKYRDVIGAFFIFDEQRLVGSGEWSNVFLTIAKKNRWILLSATPGDNWLDYIPVFVANGFYKNRTEFKREHVIYNNYSKFPKVERYVGVGRLVKQRNAILVEMPFLRHTVRRVNNVRVDHDKLAFEKVVKDRWHVYEKRPLRDVAELFSVMRRVVNTDSSRMRTIESLMEKHPKLIVFYNFDYELTLLRKLSTTVIQGLTGNVGSQKDSSISRSSATRSLGNDPSTQFMTKSKTPNSKKKVNNSCPTRIPVSTTSSNPQSTCVQTDLESSVEAVEQTSHDPVTWQDDTTNGTSSTLSGSSSRLPEFSVAEWNGHKHEPIPKTERWLYLVQYAAGSEGWNCVETDSMVFYSLTYSYKMWHQAHGRIDRLNTPFTILNYYLLMSDSLIDKAIKKALDAKKSFNESRVFKNKV